jgi:hypothetical protein
MLQYRWKCKAIIVFIVVWTFGMVYIEFICSKWIFHFISEFSWWFVFIKSLTCSSCYVAFTFFSITKTYVAPHLKYSVFLLSDWKSYLDSMTDQYQRLWMPISPKFRPVFSIIWKNWVIDALLQCHLRLHMLYNYKYNIHIEDFWGRGVKENLWR